MIVYLLIGFTLGCICLVIGWENSKSLLDALTYLLFAMLLLICWPIILAIFLFFALLQGLKRVPFRPREAGR